MIQVSQWPASASWQGGDSLGAGDRAPPWPNHHVAFRCPRLSSSNHSFRLSVSEPLTENLMRAFIKRFLMHYGVYRRYPLRRFPALRNAWRVAQP
jgi:hypothetical protein